MIFPTRYLQRGFYNIRCTGEQNVVHIVCSYLYYSVFLTLCGQNAVTNEGKYNIQTYRFSFKHEAMQGVRCHNQRKRITPVSTIPDTGVLHKGVIMQS